jgi:hypothetical protein
MTYRRYKASKGTYDITTCYVLCCFYKTNTFRFLVWSSNEHVHGYWSVTMGLQQSHRFLWSHSAPCVTSSVQPVIRLISLTYSSHIESQRALDSSVGIAAGHGLDDRALGVRVPVGSRIFTSPYRPHRFWGPWVPWVLSPGVKRTGSEADQSPLTSAEDKTTLIYTSTPPYVFMAWCFG